jgi:drug/metabolite transporter (DMT)-like permease
MMELMPRARKVALLLAGVLLAVILFSAVPVLFWFRWGTSGAWGGIGLMVVLVSGVLAVAWVRGVLEMRAHRRRHP